MSGEPTPAERRMLENKRERLKTFLKKIDEKAIFKIKHFMKESCTVDGGGKIKRGRSKKKFEPQKAQSLEEAQLEIQQHSKNLAKQSLQRSQTFESERSFEVTESCVTRSSFIKHNKSFHKLFPDIPVNEDLIHAYVCALQKEVPYHGRLYVSENYICFYSSVLLKDTKVVIPVSSVFVLKKQNTALLVPNALSIRTCEGEKHLFVSLRNRESCYKLLQSVCPQLEDGSTNSSPIFSSVEISFEQSKHTNSSQSSLEDSFDQLDRGDCGLLLSAQPSPAKVSREPVHRGNSTTSRSPQREKEDSSTEEDAGGSWVWSVTENVRAHLVQRQSSSLNTLLFIYLLLVVLLLLSSGYIGLRIVALEEQLTSLGALPEFSLQNRYKDT
ncbi:GRAM domain-containing protein 2B isoform X2 [Anguilla anguilla]|uniref:GRAM domain-containing protein 2B isoform X2 n=1 Tax=Anguilla anguilla TaxID=7936 RepID=UPI0015A7D072|nr:GRAM domain-containing protein 2B isoform X2 [Anguilla anguilla]